MANVVCMFFLMIPRPPGSTRTDPPFPHTALFRSDSEIDIMTREGVVAVDEAIRDLRREKPLPELEWSGPLARAAADHVAVQSRSGAVRSEEHTSELQSQMRISYAGFCLKKKTTINMHTYALNKTK